VEDGEGREDGLRRTRLDRRWFLAASAAFLAACGSPDGELGSRQGGLTRSDGGRATTTPSADPQPTTPPAPGPASFVVRGSAATRNVALTFHTAGDLALADQMLGILAARRTPITAFVVGEWLDAHPEWAKKLDGGGHELANHSYTHPTFSRLDPANMTSEIVRTRDLLVRLTGNPGRYFRPSGTVNGSDRPSVPVLAAAGAAGYPTVLGYDVDPLDYQDPGSAVVAQRTLAATGPGSVVSLHFGYAGTVAALPAILDGLAARNLTPVTISRLLDAN
jgi:peptidoglycan/xylan/chitin deacetylase (PgdA/CDA1 family)